MANEIDKIELNYFRLLAKGSLIDKLMTLLRVYVEHCPKNAHEHRQLAYMTGFVSELIQLKEMLDDVDNYARPSEWIDTIDGWQLPMTEGQNDAVE